MDNGKPFYIVGAGGFGREIAWLVERVNVAAHTWDLQGFIDDDKTLWGETWGSYTVLGGLDYLEKQKSHIWAVIAVGNAKARKKIADRLSSLGNLSFATLIDPGVEMSERVSVGEGSIICAGTIITVDVKIGRHSIINLDCTVGHNAQLADFVTLYPSVNVSGNVKVGECTELGTGAQFIQGITIGKGTIIGAGTVVVKDIEAEVTAVGNPAKVIKRHSDQQLGGVIRNDYKVYEPLLTFLGMGRWAA